MQITISEENRVRVGVGRGAHLEIESEGPGLTLTPIHMLGASLAGCTFSVLLSWAGSAGLEYDDLEVDLAWEFAEDPYRIGRYEMAILWPSLPPDRYGPAKSVAAQCTVEHTLRIPPEIEVSVGQ